MDVNVVGAAVGHGESKALLVVEELDLAPDHRAARAGIAGAGKTVAASKSVAAETVAAAEAIAAAETVATAEASAAPPSTLAEVAARSARCAHVGRACVDAVNRDHLQAARRILQITNDRRALRQIRVSRRLQCRCMTECVAAAFERDEAISLGRVEPLDRALYRCLRN